MPKIFQTTPLPAKGSSENAACARKNAKILSLPKPDPFFRLPHKRFTVSCRPASKLLTTWGKTDETGLLAATSDTTAFNGVTAAECRHLFIFQYKVCNYGRNIVCTGGRSQSDSVGLHADLCPFGHRPVFHTISRCAADYQIGGGIQIRFRRFVFPKRQRR